MNEGSGGCGDIPRQDSNVTVKDMRGESSRVGESSEEKVESSVTFKLAG